jgi:hypothetical protein
MRIRRRSMVVGDVQPCAELIAAHPLERKRYGKLVDQVSTVWKGLLRSGSLITCVLEGVEAGKPCVQGFGLSTFVTDEFLRRCKMPSVRWIGPEIVRCLMRGESPILGTKGVRDANSNEGLSLVAWAAALRPQNEGDRSQVQMELMSAFMQGHLGFKLKEVVSQPIDAIMMEVVLNSGGVLWDSREERYIEANNVNAQEVIQRPFILGASRETTERHLSWTTTLFQYNQPRIYFRPAEQRLLLAALKGSKDEELSDELGVSLSFVKKTWSSIYNRAVEKLPELELDISTGPVGQRGKEKKRRVLSHLREHVEELRPISPSNLVA